MSREIMDLPPPPFDRRVSYGAGEHRFGDFRFPAGSGRHPVAMVIHGGFWRAGRSLDYAGHMAAALTAAGFVTWNIEYRRIGHEGGGFPGTLEDCAAALDFLAAYAPAGGIDLDRVVAVGHSAGGHLALWLATQRAARVRLRGAVSLGGAADLRRAWELRLGDGAAGEFLGARDPNEVASRLREACPARRLPAGVPLVLLHGECDEIVPIEVAQRFSELARAAGDTVELVSLPGADHFVVVDPRTPEWRTVAGRILRLAGMDVAAAPVD